MPVEVGQQAPDFTLRDQNREDVTLSSFRGQQSVLLVFYPFAFSGLCSTELCQVRDELPSFEDENVQVVDDGHRCGVAPIRLRERAAGSDAQAQCGEVLGRGRHEVRGRAVRRIGIRNVLNREKIEPGARAARHCSRNRRGFDTRLAAESIEQLRWRTASARRRSRSRDVAT